MPYISTKTNTKISKEKEIAIKEKLGKAIELIPGKSENWLMCSFEGEQSLYFTGEGNVLIAWIEVKIFGKSTKEAYSALTQKITEIISGELGISPDKIYVKYEEVDIWGWNGANF
ncbi:phenylpyruvate tautomerase MIF-related protein [Konateibacter massiliensis]|uniref:phenylpyruvate tautomerase MIF-related protein n=1 Tax=Konateibacter massiliensis TaxID=2002841 RepID=UPI000C15C932|nr:phenylpyruvate tautomerase MIF-related protein [Konateibacter massiliensis]